MRARTNLENSSKGKLALFVIVGLLFAAIGVWTFWSQEQALNSAEKVSAQIESSSVDKEVDRQNTDDDGFQERTVDYYARITYSYTVNGQQYESSNVFPGFDSPSVSQDRANTIVSQYPEGAERTVWVDTSDPDDKSTTFVIRDRQIVAPLVFILIGGGIALAGGFGLLKKYR